MLLIILLLLAAFYMIANYFISTDGKNDLDTRARANKRFMTGIGFFAGLCIVWVLF